jgi:3-hydroxyacyl-CoA dehydrogenase
LKKAADREAELFRVCLFSVQSKAMIHAFFGERTVAKIPDIPKETRLYDVQPRADDRSRHHGRRDRHELRQCRDSGHREGDQPAKRSTAAWRSIRKNYESSVKKGRFSQTGCMDQRLALITPQLNYDGFELRRMSSSKRCSKEMALKKQNFR